VDVAVQDGIIVVHAGVLTPAPRKQMLSIARDIPGARGVIVQFRAPVAAKSRGHDE
jgi:hypothetical protein